MKVINKKARFNYQVLEEIEAGIVLLGEEVKSIKNGMVNLEGARVIEKGGEFYVTGMRVAKYKFSNNQDYDALRLRKLLLRKKEMLFLRAKSVSAGLTMVVLSVYTKARLVKVRIGLVRGRRKYEKRELIKKRTEERKIARLIK